MIYQLNSNTELIYYPFFGTVFGWRIILELNILILEYFSQLNVNPSIKY